MTTRWDQDDPNPISWPPRSFWRAVRGSGVTVAECLAADQGASPDSKQVGADTDWEGHNWYLGGLVPPDGYRRDVIFRNLLREYYEEAGYTPEADEYKVEPEHKGWHKNSKGAAVSHQVGSLDAEVRVKENGFHVPLTEVLPDWSMSPEDDPGAEEDAGPVEEEFLDSVRETARLTRGELRAVQWVADGNRVVGTDFLVSMGQATGTTQKGAERAWAKAKSKLRSEWAEEPARAPREPLRRSFEGPGWHALVDHSTPRRDTQFDRPEVT